jgi:hypothetical protein
MRLMRIVEIGENTFDTQVANTLEARTSPCGHNRAYEAERSAAARATLVAHLVVRIVPSKTEPRNWNQCMCRG